MNAMDDFVKEEIEKFEVEGKVFGYQPVTAGQENEWLPEYMEDVEIVVDGETKKGQRPNLGKVNKCKLRNIVLVPYSADDIEKVIGVKQAWLELSEEQRYKLLGKLKPSIFSAIIKNITRIDNPKKKS